MKYAYIYIVIVLALIVGGYFLVTFLQQDATRESAVAVPEGSHMMPDGTIMSNDVEMEQEDLADQTDGAEASLPIDPNAKVFEVRGVNHQFDLTEIRVKKGDTVVINFESTEGFHDWKIDEFDAETEKVQPGTPTSVTFVADQEGSFEYYCSVGTHREYGMVGKLIVEL